MLYIVTKAAEYSDDDCALEDIEIFSNKDTAKEYVKELHDIIIEPLEGIGDMTDSYEEGVMQFEIKHPQFRIIVEISEREII